MINENLSLSSFVSLKSYKNNVKRALLIKQSSGDFNEWQTDNFVLYNTSGLRKSNIQRERILYTALSE